MKQRFSTFILAIIILGSFHIANAQIQGSDIILSINPQYPSANQNVKATVSSNIVNLNKSAISWFINGSKKDEGIGKKDFNFYTENTGSQTSVEVKVMTQDGTLLDKIIIINPAGIDLLWQSYDGYTPPFYKGRSLVSEEGQYKVVAIAQLTEKGKKVQNNSITYNWKQDDTSQPDFSGYGKSFYVFKNSYLDENNTIEVTASSIIGNTTGKANITLTPSNPKIIFYEKDPIFGIKYEKALSNGFNIKNDGGIIVTEPYFFSAKNLNKDLDFTWYINGNQTETQTVKNILSVKPENGQTGSAVIKVVINNALSFFQTLENSINVNF
ncbi:hypothetical protein K8Q94_03545 [Candidatus Nomurabacteria bacterium]|nr:hypothetical protein [Candidatus Nomurabacteria bacterium]